MEMTTQIMKTRDAWVDVARSPESRNHFHAVSSDQIVLSMYRIESCVFIRSKYRTDKFPEGPRERLRNFRPWAKIA